MSGAAAREVVVGLDVGTSGLKAIAVAPDGSVVASARRGYDVSMPRDGWSEQHPGLWNEAADAALEELQAAPEVGAIAGIGLSGQMHGLVTLDSALRPVRPALLWNDQRAVEQCAWLERELGVEGLVAATGNRAFPGFTGPKLAWLREHEPESYGRVAHVLLPKDSLRLHLTGELATDVTDASGTLLLDVEASAWSGTMLEALGVPLKLLPPVRESSDVCGAWGDVPVVAGAGDQAAAALGVGIVDPGAVSVVLGTSGVMFAALSHFAADGLGRTHTFRHAAPGVWHAMGVMLSGAGALGWFRDACCPERTAGELVAEATAEGCDLAGEATELVFLPYLSGERTPLVDPLARASFVGLRQGHRRPDLVAAIMRGACFGLADCLRVLRELGVAPTVARVSGGGARSSAWVQLLADTLDLPVEVLPTTEGSAMGAAVLGAVGAGWFGDVETAAAAFAAEGGAVHEPDAARVDRLAEGHARYRALQPAIDASRPGAVPAVLAATT